MTEILWRNNRAVICEGYICSVVCGCCAQISWNFTITKKASGDFVTMTGALSYFTNGNDPGDWSCTNAGTWAISGGFDGTGTFSDAFGPRVDYVGDWAVVLALECDAATFSAGGTDGVPASITLSTAGATLTEGTNVVDEEDANFTYVGTIEIAFSTGGQEASCTCLDVP